MDYPTFLHHGAAGGVTGSCHRYLASDEAHLLIDCGLFQGQDVTAPDHHSQHRIEFDLSAVRALIVTHVHIDHVGRLPYLFAAGFRGPIICSEPSARLLPLVIEDALKVGFTKDETLINRFLAAVDQMLCPIPYKKWHTVVDTAELCLRVRLQRAGHILGSAYVEVDSWYKPDNRHHRTVFSGDLGAPYAPLLPAPRPPYGCDALIIESTYGNRLHENRKERKTRLRSVIEHALQNQGTVMIPAFSIGRTQEILYELEGLIHEAQVQRALPAADGNQERGAGTAGQVAGKTGPSTTSSALDWTQLQVIVDSPLACKFNEVYRELKPFWDAEAQQRLRAGRHPLSFDNLITINSHEDHQKTVAFLARTRQPAVVLAASGMAAGGRIVNYLKAMLADPAHCVLFVGYQARGTHGHTLQQIAAGKVAARITMDGAAIEVNAMIRSIGGYSAHADQKDLLNFVRRMRRWPSHIRIIHGERKGRETLRYAFERMAQVQGNTVEVVIPDKTTG
ncbi:MBL fold metallo-hydrolase [Gammaproteobacteria bacterium LSUCC0112]|nr:MBL fold metallo-hydrolase [Gammaproteobacteria bacterium LSUCC0112]